MAQQNRYNLRGVSVSKEDVHKAIQNIDKGLFPKVFCKIISDYLIQNVDYKMKALVNQCVFCK